MLWKPLLSLFIMGLVLVIAGFPSSGLAVDLNNGAQIFSVHCAGCHPRGGNIVRRGKTLKAKALKRYGMDSPAAMTAIVTHGKLNMPAYGDRLDTQQIEDVTAYVLAQAVQGWR